MTKVAEAAGTKVDKAERDWAIVADASGSARTRLASELCMPVLPMDF